MADLIVTFTNAAFSNVPVEKGSAARTEAIAIGVSAVVGTLSATADEQVVDLLPGADCWVQIGTAPSAEAITSGGTSTGSGRKLLSGVQVQFGIGAGEKISVIEA